MKDLGDKIHEAVLNEPTTVEFIDKKGKKVWKFKVGLLSVREVIQISQIAYKIELKDTHDLRAIHEAISTQSGKVISIIAIMIKSRTRMPMMLIRWIIKKYSTPDDFVKLIGLVYTSMSVKSFMNSIILLTGVSLVKREEIIADQEQKEKLEKEKSEKA